MSYHPSETNPALTEDRLQLLASTIVAVRADAREGHLPEKGDDAWTFGCVAYRRTCHALTGHADSGDYLWLTVQEEGHAFTLLIEGVPIKFYRGDPENPGARNLRKGLDAAIKQASFAFVKDDLGDWFWLLAIETKEDGSVLRLAIFQANEKGAIRNQYLIPLGEGPVAVLAPVTPNLPEGPDLGPPPVGPRPSFEKAGNDDRQAKSNEDDSEEE